VTQEAEGAARDVMGEARATGSTLADEAKGMAGSLKQGLSAQAEAQKNAVADRMGSVAQHLQHTAEDLRGREAWLAALMERGAREIEGMAEDLKHRDVSGLLGSVEVFARRQPALFMGAAVALGFALTRVARGDAEPYERPSSPYGSSSSPYGSSSSPYGSGAQNYGRADSGAASGSYSASSHGGARPDYASTSSSMGTQVGTPSGASGQVSGSPVPSAVTTGGGSSSGGSA
jgi:hypothetical protein